VSCSCNGVSSPVKSNILSLPIAAGIFFEKNKKGAQGLPDIVVLFNENDVMVVR
jgi:hypothetical protein